MYQLALSKRLLQLACVQVGEASMLGGGCECLLVSHSMVTHHNQLVVHHLTIYSAKTEGQSIILLRT